MSGKSGNNKAQILAEIAEIDALNELTKQKTKQLQATLRKARKARFYGQDRRQMIEPGKAMSVAEFAATCGFGDDRTCRQRLEDRGVFIDDDFNGLVMTDDFIACQMEHIERCRGRKSG